MSTTGAAPLSANSLNTQQDEHGSGLILHFLPAYAAFLMEHKLDELASEQYRLSKELKVPLIKYLSTFSEKDLTSRAKAGLERLLQALAHNKIEEYIGNFVQLWVSNQLQYISRDQVSLEDITLISLIRRKLFRDFLPTYSSDLNLYIKIMEEMDRFTTLSDTVSFKNILSIQHDLYRQAQALAQIGNWVWDLKANKITWTEELFRIYELEPEPEITTDIAALNHPEDAERVQEEMRISRETLRPHDFHYRILLKDGREKILHARGQVMTDDKGNANIMFGTLQDVTKEKQAEQELYKNQNFIHKIANLSPSLITAYNVKNGKYIFISEALLPLLGYQVREALKDGVEFFREIIHPDDLEPIMKKNDRALAIANNNKEYNDEKIVDFVYRLKHKNGKYHWFHTYGAIFDRDKTGQVEHVINISVDVTDQMNASEALNANLEELRRNEERYHKMIDEVEDYAILLLNPGGIIQNWNKGAEKIKGYKAEEIVGKNFRIFYTAEDQESRLPESLIDHAFRMGKAMHEGWRVRKDGTKFWGSIVITSLHDEPGNLIGFTKVTRDLTARKKAEENLRQYAHSLEQKNKELDQKNKELESFSYVASHDLQEPLRKILVFTTRIANQENFSEKSKDYQNRILNACNRMQMLIDALLTYSHANMNTINFEEINLNTLLDEVKRDLSELIDENAVQIEATPLPTLKVIPLQFHQLFHNILSNAIKYRNKDITPHISISASVVPNDLILPSPKKELHKISIADNGIGFEQQYAAKIFELFQRLHGKTEYAGTGVGLAICKRIAQNHNGTIIAESDAGKGATFHIYIPKD